jgi:hypothetical protein
MLIELTVAAFVGAYITVVIIGHALLAAAVLKCLREGKAGSPPEKVAAGRGTPFDEIEVLPVKSTSAKERSSQADVPIRRKRVWILGKNAPRGFSEQKQALSHDLRYVVAVASLC